MKNIFWFYLATYPLLITMQPAIWGLHLALLGLLGGGAMLAFGISLDRR